MPVTWHDIEKAPAPAGAFSREAGAPLARLVARPNQSLSSEGFVWFIGVTAAMIAVPLLAVLGSPVLWGLLPFFAISVWGVWYAIGRNRHDAAALTETLTFWPDRVELVRHERRGRERRWEANPHWIRLRLYPGSDPVENYLTLSGGGREVELGAFLSPEERAALHDQLEGRLAALRAPGHSSLQ